MLKINDKVIQIDRPELGIGIILGITHDPEALYSVDFPFLRCTRRRCQLNPYKEMQKERNITLTLDKAKEWYNKGGELKEIALQAFTEEELTKVELPKTWEEYIQQNFHREGYILTHLGSIAETEITGLRGGENLCPSKKSAEAHLAMIQLEQLRDCWRQGNIPQEIKYKIRKVRNIYTVVYGAENAFLSFCDQQTAEEFLECFRNLIEKAGDLI